MVVGKSCVFYRDSRCLLKSRFCDLFCDSMKFYDIDGNENMYEEEEETWDRKKDLVWFERLRTVSEEEADDK
jgi:hypothetical protein